MAGKRTSAWNIVGRGYCQRVNSGANGVGRVVQELLTGRLAGRVTFLRLLV